MLIRLPFRNGGSQKALEIGSEGNTDESAIRGAHDFKRQQIDAQSGLTAWGHRTNSLAREMSVAG